MDSLGIITEIIYIGQEHIELRNYAQLIGWHESYLNNASFTFSSGLVHDWVTFFRDGWANASYHDKFVELASTLRKALEADKTLFTILDKVFETAESSSDDQLVAGKRREILGDRGELLFEGTRQTLESHTLDFLRKHKHMLPKYYVPSVGGKGGQTPMSTRPGNRRPDFKDV